MKLSKVLTSTAIALSLLTAGSIAAYAQSDSKAESEAPASAATQEDKAQGKHHRMGKHHGKRSHHGHHGHKFAPRGGADMFQGLFKLVDANGDGQITQEEIDTYRAAKLAEFDASGDGALSIEEFDNLYRELTRLRMVRAFQSLDTNGDGLISTEEMDARFGNIVERMDRDGSGSLSIKRHGPRN